MKGSKILYVAFIVAAVAMVAGCSDDDNPAAAQQFGEVSGKVVFVGTWPQAGDIQVSIWASWPPAGPPAAATDPLSPGVMEQNYKIEGLNKGNYPVVTVGWRDPNNPAGAKVIGIYWANSDSLGVDAAGNPTVQPSAIEIADGKMVWENINIKANLDIIQ